MKIIISGGWGYGNLGDDAILLSTLKIIKQKYPTSQIVILTYNIEETKLIVNKISNINIQSSIHSVLSPKTYAAISYNNKIKRICKKIGNKIKFYNTEYKSKKIIQKLIKDPQAIIKEYEQDLKEYSNLCRSANLYIMAGGGYINDWNYSIASKYLEVYIAKQFNIKCYAIGQTIGPFYKTYTKKLAQKLFSNIDFMFFRDSESIKDIKEMGLNCIEDIVPDLALFETYTSTKKNQIVLIPFLHDMIYNIESIGKNLEHIVDENNSEIIITVSQLWEDQCQIALSMYFYLLRLNLNPILLIPRNLFELQNIIAQSQYVISQNLHGLILGYRSRCIVISLNSRRKFKSFMESIHASNRIIEPTNIKTDELYQIFKESLIEKRSIENDFASQISKNINKIQDNELK